MSQPQLNQPDYSIIIPAYNEAEYLGDTLAALRSAMEAVPWTGEVILCDNNSTDQTAQLAQAAGALVVFEPLNQIARARNTGARAAQGRFLIFLDADTWVQAEHLTAALTRLDSDFAGGGALVALDQARFDLAFIWNRFSKAAQLVAGCFFWMRREAFDELGGFSEAVYASEEIWFARRLKGWAKQRGLKFGILELPVTTSNRKAQWFSPWAHLGLVLMLLLFPWAVRYRSLMGFWYDRPKKSLPKR
ncbi:MAG: glycosyltransferase [bacterium]|nr:glycosyltransferase [bacterium]